MPRPSRFPKSNLVAIALGATAIASIAVQPACAADVGARIYVQPWNPELASQDQVQAAYNDASIISDSLKKAWSASKYDLKVGIFTALNGRQVAPGITLGGGAADLNDVTDISMSAAGPTLQFRVPNTVVSFSVGVEALSDADKYTAGLATGLLTPMIDVSFDLLLKLSLNVSGNAVTATAVHAIVEKPAVTPKNDAAKALKGFNDLVAFFGGPDFIKVVEDQFNNKDLGTDSLLNSINKGMTPINQAEQYATANTGYSLVSLWGDNNRLTFYYAPLPFTNIPTNGAMTGNVHWDPNAFPDASCSTFKVYTNVQTGPRPLLSSDGQDYGVAPIQRVGQFSAHAAAGGVLSAGVSSCDYTVSALPAKWFHNTSASNTAAPAGSSGGNNPQVGNLHGAGYMHSVGWSGFSVIPDPVAANKDYELLRGVAGSQALGNPRLVMPGQKEERVSVYGIDPAVGNRLQQSQTPSAPVVVNRLPTPPVQNVPRQASDQGNVLNVKSQAPQQTPQGHTPISGQAPVYGGSDRTRFPQVVRPAEPVTPGAKSSINPQPLPPRISLEPAKPATESSSMMKPGARIAINPQPLPPRVQNGTNGIK